MNAARLFTAALARQADRRRRGCWPQRIDSALRAAEDLLDGLLDISRLDAGSLKPERPCSVAEPAVLAAGTVRAAWPNSAGSNCACIAPAWYAQRPRPAARASCRTSSPTRCAIPSTAACCWRRAPRRQRRIPGLGHRPGHPARAQRRSSRVPALRQPSPWGEKGLGLGLSICERIAAHARPPDRRCARGWAAAACSASRCRSRARRYRGGAVPSQAARASGRRPARAVRRQRPGASSTACAPCWSAGACRSTPRRAGAGAEHVAHGTRPDMLLVDLHLGESLDGLAVLDILRRELAPTPPPGALITADESEDALQRRCARRRLSAAQQAGAARRPARADRGAVEASRASAGGRISPARAPAGDHAAL
jgi:CheY-like chemotaxis protein